MEQKKQRRSSGIFCEQKISLTASPVNPMVSKYEAIKVDVYPLKTQDMDWSTTPKRTELWAFEVKMFRFGHGWPYAAKHKNVRERANQTITVLRQHPRRPLRPPPFQKQVSLTEQSPRHGI